MFKRRLLVVGLLASVAAGAESFNKELERGYAFLRSGNTDEALAHFRNLQIEEPDSDLVSYSIASTWYRQGLSDIQEALQEDGLTKISDARDSFHSLLMSEDSFIRNNARFNAANCSAQMAKVSIAMGDRERTIGAFEDSIREYEEVLNSQPYHEAAQTNLNHMRYLLKTLLQNSPEQEDQSGEGEDPQEDSESEDGESEDQQQDSDQESDPSDSPEQDESQENQDQEFSGEPSDQESEPEELNRQNIEAILQSLEDQDREEQKNLRRSKTPPRVRGDRWW